MKFVVFTFDGYGLPVAHRLAREGNDVVVAVVDDQGDTLSELEKNIPDEDPVEKDRRLSLFDGMIEKLPAEKVMEQLASGKDKDDTFVFFDLNHLFRYAEQVREMGYRGNFPTEKDYCLEIDREAAKDFVSANYPAITVAAKHRFAKVSEAKAFLKNDDGFWVLKGLEEDCRTVVPDVTDVGLAKGQILDALENGKDEYESAGFILEEFIRDAFEFTPQSIYWNGERLATVMCFENKQPGAGNVGPMTDCAMDLIFNTLPSDKINEIAFPPVVEEMAQAHPGLFYWDASLYVDPRTGKIYFGEFCANRPGYNALYAHIELAGSAAKYFESIAAGKNPFPANSIAASVRVFNFHTDDEGVRRGATIDYKPRVEDHVWLRDARFHKGRLATAGYDETVAVLTGRGRSYTEAIRRMYRSMDEFSFEAGFYRPEFDFLSREYRTSILNCLDYGLQRGFYRIDFGLGQ